MASLTLVISAPTHRMFRGLFRCVFTVLGDTYLTLASVLIEAEKLYFEIPHYVKIREATFTATFKKSFSLFFNGS